VGDDAILNQILSDGVKPTRKCKGKNSGANAGRVGGTCPKESTCGKQSCVVFSSYLATSHFFANTMNIELEICCPYLVFFVTEVGINQDSGGQFRDIINAYLEPKCHSPDSEAVQRLAFIFPTLLID
jgi:flap endonuclease GEN